MNGGRSFRRGLVLQLPTAAKCGAGYAVLVYAIIQIMSADGISAFIDRSQQWRILVSSNDAIIFGLLLASIFSAQVENVFDIKIPGKTFAKYS